MIHDMTMIIMTCLRENMMMTYELMTYTYVTFSTENN